MNGILLARLTLLISVIACTYGLTGCASVQITPASGQHMVYSNGIPVVMPLNENGENPCIVVSGHGSYGSGRVLFDLAFMNRTPKPIDFGTENISVTDGAGKPIRVYTREEIEREIQRAATMQAITVGINACSQSIAAAQTSYTTYSGGYGGYYPNAPSGTYTGSATTYNPS